jgi:hypothetical protein
MESSSGQQNLPTSQLKGDSQVDPSAGTGSGQERIGGIIASLEILVSEVKDAPIAGWNKIAAKSHAMLRNCFILFGNDFLWHP